MNHIENLCMLSTQHTKATTPMLEYGEAIRVPQIAAAILYFDVIWHKAYKNRKSI